MNTHDWTTLGELRHGAVYETRYGVIGCKVDHYSSYGGTRLDCILLDSGVVAHFPPGDHEEVREVDLRFLLACAADRLKESEAYRRGFADGADAMREKAVKASETHLYGRQIGHLGASLRLITLPTPEDASAV